MGISYIQILVAFTCVATMMCDRSYFILWIMDLAEWLIVVNLTSVFFKRMNDLCSELLFCIRRGRIRKEVLAL